LHAWVRSLERTEGAMATAAMATAVAGMATAAAGSDLEQAEAGEAPCVRRRLRGHV
jgi:uncharacterized membrane protein